MRQTYRCIAAALVAGACALASSASGACALAPMDAVRIKQMMAREIEHRLGLEPGRLPIGAISTPQLHSPYALDALCQGQGALHHSAGFRYAQFWRLGPGPLPPLLSPGPDSVSMPAPADSANSRGQPPYATCSYEGVAVVLGYDYSSPVAVHFKRSCQ